MTPKTCADTAIEIATVHPVRSWMDARDQWLVETPKSYGLAWEAEAGADSSDVEDLLGELHAGATDAPMTAASATGTLHYQPVEADAEVSSECYQESTGAWYTGHEHINGTCTRCDAEEAGDGPALGTLVLIPPTSPGGNQGEPK